MADEGPGFQLYVGDVPVGQVFDIKGPRMAEAQTEDEYISTLLTSASVTFDMLGAVETPFSFDDNVRSLVIEAPVRPAWWGRVKERMLRARPRVYTVARTHARLRGSSTDSMGAQTLTFVVTGPVEGDIPPTSRLERIWARICSSLKGSR